MTCLFTQPLVAVAAFALALGSIGAIAAVPPAQTAALAEIATVELAWERNRRHDHDTR